jgi:ribonuclease P protein component
MFSRAKRLSRADFPRAAAARRRASTAHLSMVAGEAAAGYAAVVSKAVARRSVDRHTLKRRLLALLAAERLPPSLIVYARKGAPALSYPALKAELRALLAEVS